MAARPPALAVVTVLVDFADDQVGVVIAFLRAPAEFLRLIEQARDTRRRERAEQRKLQRARGVKRELVEGVEVDDLQMIALWVKLQDVVEIGACGHTAPDGLQLREKTRDDLIELFRRFHVRHVAHPGQNGFARAGNLLRQRVRDGAEIIHIALAEDDQDRRADRV